MATCKYTGLMIVRNCEYTDADGNKMDVQPAYEARLIDAMNNGGKYVFVELFTKVGVVKSNTQRGLAEAAYATGVYFDEIYILRK